MSYYKEQAILKMEVYFAALDISKKQVANLLPKCTPRQQVVVKRRLEGTGWDEIALELDVCRERARQLLKAALEKMLAIKHGERIRINNLSSMIGKEWRI